MRGLLSFASAALVACGGGGDSARASTSPCGDLDGTGGDTGNLPDLIGRWTVRFAAQLYEDRCGVGGFDQLSEDWLLNTPMEVRGSVPGGLYATFDRPDEYLWGIESSHGGIVFSGIRQDDLHGAMHVALGGMAYTDPSSGLDVITGFGFIGLELGVEGAISCYARGDFQATKSGG